MKDQKIAVVTGANRGLGLAITRQLAEMGIHVVATARDAALGQAMLQQLQAENLSVSTFALEVTDAPRTVEEGADTPVWLATLPAGGPTGGFYRDRETYPW